MVRDWLVKSVQDRRVYTRPDPWSPPVITDLDTLLTDALYVELTDRITPRAARSAAGRAGRRKSPTPS